MATTREEKLRIWRGAVDAEKHARYYAVIAHRAKMLDTLISIAILVSSSGSALALLASFPNEVSVAFFATVALLTIMDMMIGFSSRAATARLISNQSRELTYNWERLWIYRESDSAMESADDLERRLGEITSDETFEFKCLASRCEDEANEVILGRLTPEERELKAAK